MTRLYHIENVGCDDSTNGLARISDEDFPKFKEIIENLNKNSYYGCMPKIAVFRIEEDQIREVTGEEEGGLYSWQLLHLDGRTYTFAKPYAYREEERVI
jgi:hypothetical protein